MILVEALDMDIRPGENRDGETDSETEPISCGPKFHYVKRYEACGVEM